MEKMYENSQIEKDLSLEEMREIDMAIEHIVRTNEGILLALRENTEGYPKEKIAEAFASNFKFKVADFLKRYLKIKDGKEEKFDESIIKRLKERAPEFI